MVAFCKRLEIRSFSTQSSLSTFAQKYLPKCKDIYFILQNKHLHIYEDSFGAKIIKDDCALSVLYMVCKRIKIVQFMLKSNIVVTSKPLSWNVGMCPAV